MKKVILLIVMLFAMVVVMAGCKGDKGKEQTPSPYVSVFDIDGYKTSIVIDPETGTQYILIEHKVTGGAALAPRLDYNGAPLQVEVD